MWFQVRVISLQSSDGSESASVLGSVQVETLQSVCVSESKIHCFLSTERAPVSLLIVLLEVVDPQTSSLCADRGPNLWPPD